MPEVIIDGVRYAPINQQVATEARFYYMHDGHYFTRLKGNTLDEVIAHADTVESGECGSYGMLCPVIVMACDKELRRVGPPAHSYGPNDEQGRWGIGKVAWREAVEADPDIMRLLAQVGGHTENKKGGPGE